VKERIETMTTAWVGTSRLRTLAVVGLVVGCAACGGDSTSPSTPPPVQSPSPPAPTPTPSQVILHEAFDLQARQIVKYDYTTEQAGTVDYTLQYQNPESEVSLWATDRQCNYWQFGRDDCDYLVKSLEGSTPRTMRATGVPAGTYSIFVGSGAYDEHMVLEIAVTPDAAAASGRD
jgi:hypothetical protein